MKIVIAIAIVAVVFAGIVYGVIARKGVDPRFVSLTFASGKTESRIADPMKLQRLSSWFGRHSYGWEMLMYTPNPFADYYLGLTYADGSNVRVSVYRPKAPGGNGIIIAYKEKPRDIALRAVSKPQFDELTGILESFQSQSAIEGSAR